MPRHIVLVRPFQDGATGKLGPVVTDNATGFERTEKVSNQGEKKFCPRALQLLTSYFWEGNLEQVRFVIRYALTVSQGNTMGLNDLPKYLLGNTATISDDASPEATERETLVAALNLNNWNVSRTASYLGLSRATLNRRIRNLGVKRPIK